MQKIINSDCMLEMDKLPNNYTELTLTDIPYGEVSKNGEERAKYSGQLRKIDKSNADILNFDIGRFLEKVYRITKGTIIIFCGNEQYSTIYNFFNEKSKNKEGTVRQLIWAKTNPSPMNGQYIYLSGTENAVWFRKSGGTFNAHCKKNVFSFPCGRSKLHPTEKNHNMLKELILDNSNSGDMVFDPCMGSGSHLLVAGDEGRRITGIELDDEYFKIAKDRLEQFTDVEVIKESELKEETPQTTNNSSVRNILGTPSSQNVQDASP